MNKIDRSKINTRNLFGIFALAAITLVSISCSTDETQTVTTFDNLVMADEFDGTSINTSMWTYDIGRGPNNDGWGNNELQYYTDRPENIRVEDGMLVITAIEERCDTQGPPLF